MVCRENAVEEGKGKWSIFKEIFLLNKILNTFSMLHPIDSPIKKMVVFLKVLNHMLHLVALKLREEQI